MRKFLGYAIIVLVMFGALLSTGYLQGDGWGDAWQFVGLMTAAIVLMFALFELVLWLIYGGD